MKEPTKNFIVLNGECVSFCIRNSCHQQNFIVLDAERLSF
jgi:hypothetical protein